MYAEIYPHLNKKHQVDNFEQIAEAIDKYFSDVFQLSVLDSEAKNLDVAGSYTQLFDLCMAELNDLYTVDEVVETLCNFFQTSALKDQLLTHFTFVPSIGNQTSKQIGFLEKIAVGDLQVGEPLSFLDMMRAVNGLKRLKEKGSCVFEPVTVVTLKHLPILDSQGLIHENSALIVNLNSNLKGTPKWGVVDLEDKQNPCVYCETPLTENEKYSLEKSLNIKIEHYVGARANSLASTGYTALAWLDTNITKAWNFDVNADFTSLLKEFMLVQFGGDNPGLSYSFTEQEQEKFCSPAFRHVLTINNQAQFSDPSQLKYHQLGWEIFRLVWLAGLGKVGGRQFRPSDIAAVVNIAAESHWRAADINRLVYEAARTFPPRFAATLSAYPELLKENETSTTLVVPPSIDFPELNKVHQQQCKLTHTDCSWLEVLPEQSYAPRVGDREEYYAVMMILTLVRAKSKKGELIIDLPERFQLNANEQQFVIASLSDNAYVREFKTNNNRSLQVVKQALIPTLARNRWLAESGYRPPMIDNYWRQAAKHWLIHLHEAPEILTPKPGHDVFKRCVLEMGIIGLKEVLTCLRDDSEREFIERVYGRDNPAFYAACQPEDYPAYLGLLLGHLTQQGYFPFSELGIAYQPGNDEQLLPLLTEINQLDQFETITLTDCLKHQRVLGTLLRALIQSAEKNNWTVLVIIPELEDKVNVSADLRELRVTYALLNDVILRNRRLQAADKHIKRIQECSDFTLPDTKSTAVIPKPQNDRPSDPLLTEALDSLIDNALHGLEANGKWPLKKGGAVQLQLQQQQQIEQNRQIQQEQQHMIINVVEEAIAGELVTYTNIDRILGEFYADFAAENSISEHAASLKTAQETDLQGFFHTWINANPDVDAIHAIQQMTPDAAKALLRKHHRLPSGLNPDNLPKGFYTQRSKDGKLILCFSPELSYVSLPNALTLNLDVHTPRAEAWEGDFRQFNLDKYQDGIAPFDEHDWNHIILFAQLQPRKSDYTADFAEFRRNNPQFKPGWISSGLLDGHEDKITNNWLVFVQAWQYAGQKGIEQFLAMPETHLSLPSFVASQLLLQKQPAALQEWVVALNFDEASLRALGQVYYHYGDQGVMLFLSKLRQIDVALGRAFLDQFNDHVLRTSDNYSCFMSQKFYMTMDDMIEKLKPHDANTKLQAWQTIMAQHIRAVGWENVETLWQGFEYFTSELEQLGLKLQGDEFDGIADENMLTCMDRILCSLKKIPSLEMQQKFLRDLATMDRTHGGVHYALQHEGFKYFDSQLELHDFMQGAPTYKPDLTTLYSWEHEEAVLNMKRVIASQAQFGFNAYETLANCLGNDNISSKNALVWILHTQFDAREINLVLQTIETIDPRFQALIARHLHHAVYSLENRQLAVSLDAMRGLAESTNVDLLPLLNKYPHGTLLEAVTILHQSHRLDRANLKGLFTLLAADLPKPLDYPDYLYREGYKLATLFGIDDPRLVQSFYECTANLRPIVQHELRLLITQLLSIDYANSDLSALVRPENANQFLQCIEVMKQNLAHTTQHRIDFISLLNDQGIIFQYSKSGEFRALTTRQEDGPDELGFFIDHDARLWQFMQAHLAVPVRGNAQEALQPIMRFLKKLQLNRTYLNEIEPLLSTLEQTKAGTYWSSTYFYQLLRALQPDNDQTAFPISLLKVMLQEEIIAAKPIDGVEKDFPAILVKPLQAIIVNSVFDRNQQAILCQIALREYDWQGNITLLHQIMSTLSSEAYIASRGYALDILAKSANYHELESRFENCRWLLQHTPAPEITSQWTQTTALWLSALSERKKEEELLAKIKSDFAHAPNKLALILHIIAYSCLRPGLKDNESHEYELNKKSFKLAERLGALSEDDLVKLAQCYPQQPSPSADDILRLMKNATMRDLDWSARLDSFMRNPFPEPRADFGVVTSTRDADLQRMIAETTVSGTQEQVSLRPQQAARLTLIFSYLKRLERGDATIQGADKAVSAMNQQELAESFQRLSQASAMKPNDDLICAQIWTVLFEVLGRTTRKYPHLAQQFALISNDICVDAHSRVLQLATGEGKSHFVALRAAKHAGLGKTVDVCTAKRTLAKRDLEDYQSLFSYLGLTTAYIHPKSSHETYINSQIHYSTTGDLSLFLDEQSYSGHPVEIEPDDRVALFDEFDFIRFEEGRKTEYNYARPTGKTPKQMTWFYQAANAFYKNNETSLNTCRQITVDDVHSLTKFLQKSAGENEEKQNLIKGLLRDPLQLVQWLQSAYEAHVLEWGVHFTVREENIEVGDESYPMREIIPLSSDNQKMVGSTFSAGVQQLLAVRLNTEAKDGLKPQNFHIHPESNIISSQVAAQRMQALWGTWEGFSGTISTAQATTLNREHGTEVLHVPTNQRDLRLWHKPGFYHSEKKRLEALMEQINYCLENKQSILFSCKNDRHVLALKAQLEVLIPTAILEKHFIFYTNEEHRSAAEVLEDKQKKENWHGGKKQQAVGLVASGFGRGDNVGVEAVFLFDVNDTNDKLQKGGRTARNGAEGAVFQFYLHDELVLEEEHLWSTLRESLEDDDVLKLGAEMEKLSGLSESERCFEQVMLLREYVFSMQNAANQGYHNAVAQLSSWGMKTLGQIEDPVIRQELTSNFSNQLKNLDKLWINISSRQQSVDEKIDAIEHEVIKSAIDFTTRGQDAGAGVDEFNLMRRQPTQIQLIVAKTQGNPTKMQQAMGSICSVLATLPDLELAHRRTSQIPGLLGELAKNEIKLKKFAQKIVDCISIDAFMQQLQFAVQQVRTPSQAWDELSAAAFKSIARTALLEGVSDDTRISFETALDALASPLQDLVIDSLGESGLLSAQRRLDDALPILNYLAKFPLACQLKWGAAYIERLDSLLHENSNELLKLRMGNCHPMSLDHFNALWNIANNTCADKSQLTEVLIALDRAVQASPEQRVRLLAQWEAWSSGMDKDSALPFLLTFCRTMERFEEGRSWDTFTRFMKKTQQWWNKGGEGAYKPALVALWKELAEHATNLPALKEVLDWGLRLDGKSWFQGLTTGLKSASDKVLVAHLEQIKSLWSHLDTGSLSKRDVTAQFTQCLQSLESFYLVIRCFDREKQLQLHQDLLGLDVEKFTRMLRFVAETRELTTLQPVLLEAMLGYLHDPSISLGCSDLLRQVLMRVAHSQMPGAQVDIAHLINGIDRFKACDERTLSRLLNLMGQNGEYAIEPLFDHATLFLAERLPDASEERVREVIQLFYKAAKTQRGNIDGMMSDETLRDLFAFSSDESKDTRDKRVIWMYLLNQNIFMTPGVSDADNHDYHWDEARNVSLLQAGFNQYILHTHKILESKPAKACVHKTRDLDIQQQEALLKLTDELSIIDAPQLRPVQSFEQLSLALGKLMRGYQSSWFKSQARIEQSAQLQAQISSLLQDPRGAVNNYETVLTSIRHAKLAAMASDSEENKTRWFKVNRSGQSRYFNTLNQMQDMVLRHWTQDLNAVQRFQCYQAYNKQEFNDLVAQLEQAVSEHYERTYPDQASAEYKYISKRLERFFSRPDDMDKLVSLRRALVAFQNSPGEKSPEQVNALVTELQQIVPRLPGHLQTLTKELLARGDSLMTNLSEQADVNELKNTLGV